MRLTSSGAVCVHVKAGGSADPGVEPACTSSLPPPAATGRGRSKPKFLVTSPGQLEGNSDSFSNTVSASAGGGTTTSAGAADWEGIFVPDLGAGAIFGAVHGTSAQVTSTGAGAISPGRAVGEAKDPIEFVTPAASTLSYGAEILEMRLKADSSGARNRLRVVATFENVTRNGTPLTGSLWTLTISSQGKVSAPADLALDLTLWSGLGIPAAQEAAAEAYLRSHLVTNADGSIGFTDAVAVFGGDSPLAEILLSHPANQVIRYLDAVAAESELAQTAAVPALPAGGALGLAVLLAGLGLRHARRSRNKRHN